MTAYWITFAGRPAACVEAEDEEAAKVLASKLGGVPAVRAQRLPYPADPRLNSVPFTYRGADGRERQMTTPSFCYRPADCIGRSSCPQRYACTE